MKQVILLYRQACSNPYGEVTKVPAAYSFYVYVQA